MTERNQPDNRSDNQPEAEQTIQPTDLNESAAPSPTEQAPTADASPADPAVEAVASTQTSTPQTHADVESSNESSKEPEPGEPAEPVEQSTAASSDEPASPASEEPAQTEQPTEKVQATETTSEDATPTPAEVPAPAAAPAAPAEPAVDPQEAMDAAKWGRVDGEGRVYVQDGGAEREVGQFPDAPIAEAMAFYVRRYLDLKATIDLFATRLPQLSVREIDSTLSSISESLTEPAAVGDLEGLRARFAALKTVAAERREAVSAERAAAKEQALKERTAIVERAEAIAEQDPARTQWKNSGAELRELLESWKAAQRRGPRLDRPTEDGLWKRFSHARTTFDRHRRQFFSQLDQAQSEAKRVKEALIAEAEALSSSVDWSRTSGAYRELMNRWKAAPRASRKEDDALWARFRAAQQVFFDARRAKDEATDAEYRDNLVAKEAILVDAEAILPVTDIDRAKAQLRQIQDRWEEVGRVPSADLHRIEGRLRAVEAAVREAEEKEWRRTNPETRARAAGMVGQLEEQIAQLERSLSEAEAKGDEKAARNVREALETKRAWLAQISSSME